MRKIVVDYAYTVAHEIVRVILPLATAPHVARVLGADGIGTHAYARSIANYFLLFALLGVKTHGNRSIAAARHDRQERSRVFCDVYCAQVGMALLCTLAYIVYARVAVRPDLSALFHWQIPYVASAFVDIDWFFLGLSRFRKMAVRSVAVKGLSAALLFLLVRQRADLPLYAAIMAGSFFASPLLLFPAARRELAPARPDLFRVLKHLQSMLVLFLPVMAVSLYRTMDKIMLGSMANMAELGQYENAEKIVSAASGLVLAFGTVMLPRMAWLAAREDAAKSESRIARSMALVAPLASALSFGLIAVAPHLVAVFYEKEFHGCAPLLAGLSATIPLLAIGSVIRTHDLIPNRRDMAYTASAFGGAVVNLALNALLIPSHGARGAVAATTAAEFSVLLCQFIAARRVAKWRHLRSGVFFWGAGALMCAAVRRMASRSQPGAKALLAEVFVGAGLYALLCAAYLCAHGRPPWAWPFAQRGALAALTHERRRRQ